jgi:hypothetical protein
MWHAWLVWCAWCVWCAWLVCCAWCCVLGVVCLVLFLARGAWWGMLSVLCLVWRAWCGALGVVSLAWCDWRAVLGCVVWVAGVVRVECLRGACAPEERRFAWASVGVRGCLWRPALGQDEAAGLRLPDGCCSSMSGVNM